MVAITFPDSETESRALAFLLHRFSGKVFRSGEHLLPEAALSALADQNIPFIVRGRATDEQQMAAVLVGPSEKAAVDATPVRPSSSQEMKPGADEKNAASIALLQSWLEEDATDDPDEIQSAQEELEQFKQAINAERERAGSRRIYP